MITIIDLLKKRRNIFESNLNEINLHNQKYNNGKATYTKGITQFTDMVCLINILNYNNI